MVDRDAASELLEMWQYQHLVQLSSRKLLEKKGINIRPRLGHFYKTQYLTEIIHFPRSILGEL